MFGKPPALSVAGRAGLSVGLHGMEEMLWVQSHPDTSGWCRWAVARGPGKLPSSTSDHLQHSSHLSRSPSRTGPWRCSLATTPGGPVPPRGHHLTHPGANNSHTYPPAAQPFQKKPKTLL